MRIQTALASLVAVSMLGGIFLLLVLANFAQDNTWNNWSWFLAGFFMQALFDVGRNLYRRVSAHI